MDDQRVLAIRNARAAEDQALEAAFGRLHGQGYRFDLPTLSHAGDGRRVVASGDAAHADLILAAGGDGTLNEVVNGLYDAGRLDAIPVGLLPYGTGNDFATGCGIAQAAPETMLARALEGVASQVDVGRADDRCFMNAVSGGVGAEATAETPRWLKDGLGKMAYFITGAIKAGNLEGKEAVFEAEGFHWSGRMLGFVVANGSHAGGNVRVSPEARFDDGLLDLTIFPERPFRDLTEIAAHYMLPSAAGIPDGVVAVRSAEVTLRASDTLHINLDGEPLRATGMRFGVLPSALCFQGAQPHP